ncbi:MAG: hypothetical protein AAF629_28930 [Chloroflexota bacterium]
MNTVRKTTAFTLSFTLIAAISFVFLFIATAIVPYWQGLSGIEIQAWFMDHFGRFSYLMVPVHFLSIITMIIAYIMHRKDETKRLWLLALITFLICQFFNFFVYGPNFNPALSSGTLDPAVALATLDQWDFYHVIRTISVCISLVSLGIISIVSRRPADSEYLS